MSAPIHPKLSEHYPYGLITDKGKQITFRIAGDAGGGGMCAECFFYIPALRVAKDEMALIAGGKTYRVKRPKAFYLDEASLVDESMQKVLRTWQMPFQAAPYGISRDGSKLYVEFYEGQGPKTLVLELTESGSVQFRARGEVEGRGEWITEHPKDEGSAYLSFMRFHVGGKNYIVRFEGPCT